jgi:hypothetical protein
MARLDQEWSLFMTQLIDALDEAMARAMFDDHFGATFWHLANEPERNHWLLQARAARLALAEALAERGLKVVSEEVTREMARAALERPSSDTARTLYEDIWTAMHPVAPDLLTEGGE